LTFLSFIFFQNNQERGHDPRKKKGKCEAIHKQYAWLMVGVIQQGRCGAWCRMGCTRERDGGGGLGFEEKDNGDGTQCNQQ
jgi:hypothetical protein